MLAELLTWGFIAGAYVLSFGVLALPKHWYRTAQVLFVVATLLADTKILYWEQTSSHGLAMRRSFSSFGLLATTLTAIWFIRKVQKDIREASGRANETQNPQRARIEEWRRMVTLAERKFKSGKEPGVSFAEIFQRQPAYIELEPYLSEDALAVLKEDRAGTVKTVGLVNGREFLNPPDALRSVLAHELARIEKSPDLPPAFKSKAISGFIEPELDITFDESGKGFVHPFTDKSLDPKNRSIVDWKRYRVALRSRSTAPGTRLIAVDVALEGGDNYPSLPLRIMGNPEAMEFKLHAGIPQLWDVVEKPVGSDWIRLTQKTVPEFIVRVPYSFKMTASCDQGFSVSKLVTLDVDGTNNNELMFRLDDCVGPPFSS